MSESQIWTSGKQGEPACLTATSYSNGAMVITAEGDNFTEAQFKAALKAEWPDTPFLFNKQDGYWRAEV